jgi:hypothetical protein
MRPSIALIFAIILALPSLAIFLLSFAGESIGFSLFGLALFAIIAGLYFAAAYAVLCHAE